MQKFSTLVFFVLVALVGWAQADSPISLSSLASSASDDADVGQPVAIQGLVRLEKRHTVIPLSYCQTTDICPESKPYWSLVIYADSGKYEIDQRFGEGVTRQPEAVELGGKTINAGSVIKLDATVEYASPEYYIIGDVQNVVTVMDYTTVSLPNWTCHGNLDRETQIQADVWFAGNSGTSERPALNRYGLRLFGSQEGVVGRRNYPLAALVDVQGYSGNNSVVYQGENTQASVELIVDQTSPTLAQAPAKLKVSLAELPEEARDTIPSHLNLSMVCNRTR